MEEAAQTIFANNNLGLSRRSCVRLSREEGVAVRGLALIAVLLARTISWASGDDLDNYPSRCSQVTAFAVTERASRFFERACRFFQ